MVNFDPVPEPPPPFLFTSSKNEIKRHAMKNQKNTASACAIRLIRAFLEIQVIVDVVILIVDIVERISAHMCVRI